MWSDAPEFGGCSPLGNFHFLILIFLIFITSFFNLFFYYFSYRHSSLEKHSSTLVLHVGGQLTSFMFAC